VFAETLQTLDHVYQFLEYLFGGDRPQHPLLYHQVAMRSLVVYVVGIACVRLGKSRLIARATAIDVLLGFILGSVLGRGITGSASLSETAVATAALVAIHFLITSLAIRSRWFETLVKGHDRPVIVEGKMQRENLDLSHLTESDLHEQLRLQGVAEIEEVALATKERNGEVSVIRRKSPPRLLDIAVANGVQTVRIVVD
jgi:uncharacterized membrane protein YcaP (DUF421 family)